MSDDKLEIEYTHEEMEELEEEVKTGLKQLDKLDGAKRQEKANHLDDRLKRLKTLLTQFKLDLMDIKDREMLELWERFRNEHNQRIQRFLAELSASNAQFAKKSAARGTGQKTDPNEMTAIEMTQLASKIQDQDKDILDDTLAQVLRTEELAQQTAIKLKIQTEQATQIKSDLDHFQDVMKTAGKVLREFVKNLSTDKIFMCVLFLLICAIIFIIVWKIKNPDIQKDVLTNMVNDAASKIPPISIGTPIGSTSAPA